MAEGRGREGECARGMRDEARGRAEVERVECRGRGRGRGRRDR